MPFTISELPLGGGTLAICPMPGRGGAYAADLAALRAYAPGLVLSMTPLQEMADAGAGDLPADLSRLGILWQHLPVADFGTPDREVSQGWGPVAARAGEVLAAGGRVLIHCRGGCGRSGMAALRLMVEAGETPDAALTRLRAARPCAVETAAQLAWAASARP